MRTLNITINVRKIDAGFLVVAGCAIVLAMGLDAQADIGPPVEIKMAPDTHQAVAGQEYAGTFEVRVFRPGQLLGFDISGEGWTIVSTEFPDEPHDALAGVLNIPFRAVPADADKPIRLTMTYNGRRVAQAYEIGPDYFGRAGKPHRSVRVHESTRPAADVADAGGSVSEAGGGSRSSNTLAPRSSALQVVGRVVFSRPGRILGEPDSPDGEPDDPADIPPVTVGADHIDVRIWDSDPVGHETIWSGATDENGYFDTGVVDWDDSGDDPDLVLYYETEVDPVVDVTDNSTEEWTYFFESDEVTDFTGSFYDFGWHSPADEELHPALQIFNSITRTRRFIIENPGYITPLVQVEWPDDSKDGGAWYEDFSNEIHISTERQWRNDTHSHEYGHHFMDSLYEPDLPPSDYCIDPSCDDDNEDEDCGHCMWCEETSVAAWSEGWSNWLADLVTRDYPNRYTHDVNGPPFVPLYTRSQESPAVCDDSGMFEDPLETEGFIGALLRDIDDAGQDDHDDDPDPDVGSFDGIFDLLCLGPNEVFFVTDIYAPVTIIDFINGFLTEYPQHTDLFWPTAFNVGGAPYVSMFPTDTEPPGLVPSCDSLTHPIGTGGPWPCMKFAWSPARDDVQGANAYSYVVTTDPLGEDPDEVADIVDGADDCLLNGWAGAGVTPGLYYFSIKAQDNAGNWGETATFGPFEITDCNDTGLLDLCDIDCEHAGVPDVCSINSDACTDLPGCGESEDCQPNYVPDECDIESGTSADCNFDGIPDECQNMANWVGDSGLWDDPDNWESDATPGQGEIVCINALDEITVSYTDDVAIVTELSCHDSLIIQGGPPWISFTIVDPSFVLGDLTFGSTNAVLTVDTSLEVDGLFTWPGQTSGVSKLTGAGVTTLNGGLQISSGTVTLRGCAEIS